ncbi:hypothetical protein LguiB_020461 [Lonicera macranthoides]
MIVMITYAGPPVAYLILSTLSEINDRIFQVPSNVMKTAIMPQNTSENLLFYWTVEKSTDLFYIYMHFAEVEALQLNQSRSFNIYLNGELLYASVSPRYLSAFTLYNESPASCNGNFVCRLTISINRTDNSTLPPIINALELYKVIQYTEPETNENDLIRRVEAELNENNNTLETKNRQFTYSEVLSMTNNFQRVIGKGGFGTVYHGYHGATQVAVKMLSPSSIQGYKEFQSECNGSKGDIKHIVDPRLREEFDVNSVWKAVELARACVSRTSTKRPTMNYVVMELKECLAIETAKRTDSKESVGLISMNLDSGMDPQAR